MNSKTIYGDICTFEMDSGECKLELSETLNDQFHSFITEKENSYSQLPTSFDHGVNNVFNEDFKDTPMEEKSKIDLEWAHF